MFTNIPLAVMEILPFIGASLSVTTLIMIFLQNYRQKVMVAGLQLGKPNKNQKKMNIILGVGIGIFLLVVIGVMTLLTLALRVG